MTSNDPPTHRLHTDAVPTYIKFQETIMAPKKLKAATEKAYKYVAPKAITVNGMFEAAVNTAVHHMHVKAPPSVWLAFNAAGKLTNASKCSFQDVSPGAVAKHFNGLKVGGAEFWFAVLYGPGLFRASFDVDGTACAVVAGHIHDRSILPYGQVAEIGYGELHPLDMRMVELTNGWPTFAFHSSMMPIEH